MYALISPPSRFYAPPCIYTTFSRRPLRFQLCARVFSLSLSLILGLLYYYIYPPKVLPLRESLFCKCTLVKRTLFRLYNKKNTHTIETAFFILYYFIVFPLPSIRFYKGVCWLLMCSSLCLSRKYTSGVYTSDFRTNKLKY